MPSRRKSANAAEIARIEELIGDLETRLRRLNRSAHSEAAGASDDISQFVGETLDDIMERVRQRADAVTSQVADRASRAGADAYRQVIDDIGHYPLATLAVAAGIGFLLGSSRR